jgi:hypothetical protein
MTVVDRWSLFRDHSLLFKMRQKGGRCTEVVVSSGVTVYYESFGTNKSCNYKKMGP